MPELPEVETTLRAIEKFQSLKIHEVKIYNRNLRWKISKDFESLTIGQTVENLKRRAKYLIFHLSNEQNIILHLGMSGSLRIAKNNENFFIKHDHVELIFDDERIIYNDPRRFGSMHVTSNYKKHKLIKNKGDYVGILFLGIVVRGETTHYELVTTETFRSIGNLAMDYPQISVINNVICVENENQLKERLFNT